jgi:superfamily II DNA or RNA helicase
MKRYQTTATNDVMSNWLANPSGSSLVVLATGLGKTRVAAEAVRRVLANRPDARVVVLAHRNELVYQLERAFWPFLTPDQPTAVWNGYERPDAEIASQASLLFCCVDSVLGAVRAGGELPVADVVVVDECHHLGSDMYETVLDALSVGIAGGPYLVGLTATPWRPNGEGLDHRFQTPAISIDLVEGLKQGFLSNVDYRMFTDNVDWDRLRGLTGRAFSPASINRSLFIDEWDDAVVDRLREAWSELATPKAIVFCGTIHHAERVAARINALGFARARCVLSQTSAGQAMSIRQRSQVLWDFAEGRVQVVCAVDVLNEGVDVPDVNIVVFQRVTHSRRIFVQQLGRGLRVAAHKSKVIVLDFVSDVRRFAAGLELEAGLGAAGRGPAEVQLGSKVSFRRANSEDTDGLTFLREWLHDVAAIQDAGDEASVLAYPPIELLPGARR